MRVPPFLRHRDHGRAVDLRRFHVPPLSEQIEVAAEVVAALAQAGEDALGAAGPPMEDAF